jgi:competence protein ComEA
MFWTSRQRGALCWAMAAILAAMFVRMRLNPAHINDPQTEAGERAQEVLSQIDPNIADWPTLAALPSIGPSLAKRIVEEREAFVAEHPGEIPYRQLDDLLRVKGIGPAILDAIAPYLTFSQIRPTTTHPLN